jgi:hypothetical protein
VPIAIAIFNNLRADLAATKRLVAPEEPTSLAKLLILNKLKLAERVGFVPDGLAPINGLGPIGASRNRQIH